MAKSEKQKKIDDLKNRLWDAVQEQIQTAIDNDDEIDYYYDWEAVTDLLHESSFFETAVEVGGGAHKEYEGKLLLSPSDRKKVIDHVTDSCLTEKAKTSILELIED